MANTIKTLSDGDLVREYLASFHNKLKVIKTVNRQYDSRFAREGAKNGGQLLIKDPNEYEVTDGPVMNTADLKETTQTLVVATQKHISAPPLSSVEHTMSVDDFRAMYIEPAMSKLAAMVEFDFMDGVYKQVYQLTGTPATTPASLAAIMAANSRISQQCAPETDRYVVLDSVGMASTVGSMATYFHKASEIERAFSEGYVGYAAGFKWIESNMIPNHTNGTREDTSSVTSEALTSGKAEVKITGGNVNKTFLAGDVFTVAGVYDVNPETKQRYSHLKQFVVTENVTSNGSGVATLKCSPTPYLTGVKKNCDAPASTNSVAVVYVAAGGSGAAGAVYSQPLAYHKDAFTFVSADLHIEPGERMTRAVAEGISMRLWRGSDIVNDRHFARIDVLYGYKALRPSWAARVRG